MKFIKTKLHGWLDYSVALFMIAAPWLFRFNSDGWETWIFPGLGLLTIMYSLCTDYESGITPQLSMRTHLVFDTINGLLLASSPWLFSFAHTVWKPHLFVGIAELLVVLFSRTTPVAERKRHPSAMERWETNQS